MSGHNCTTPGCKTQVYGRAEPRECWWCEQRRVHAIAGTNQEVENALGVQGLAGRWVYCSQSGCYRKHLDTGTGIPPIGWGVYGGLPYCTEHLEIFAKPVGTFMGTPLYENTDLACTAVVQTPVREWPNCAKSEWVAKHDNLIERLSRLATEHAGTPYKVFVERNLAFRDVEMCVRCESCRELAIGSVRDEATEERNDWADVLMRNLLSVVKENGDCRCVDGLTPERCLGSYAWWLQQLDGPLSATSLLTPRQRTLAQREWSAALRSRQAEARERERVEVVVERDEDGL
jgi:hypothetical protein